MLDPQTIELLRQLGYDPTLVERVLSAGLWITLATVLAAIPTGIIARRRGRSVVGWVLLALSLPLIPLLLGYRLPAQTPEQPAP